MAGQPTQLSGPVLQTRLGQSLILAAPGRGSLHILNSTAALMWRRRLDAGPGREHEALMACLVEDHGLPESEARLHVDAVLADWRGNGLLSTEPADAGRAEEWAIPAPRPSAPAPGDIALTLAGCAMALRVDDPGLRQTLTRALAPMLNPSISAIGHVVCVTGGADTWTLTAPGGLDARGISADAAILAALETCIELACRTEDRLLVVHGAGLIAPDGRALLLAAPGGSGKTTLAAALNARGWGLLSDDVVPVTSAGKLLGLGAPICLKPGSWPLLARLRPDIGETPAILRFGAPVKLIPPLGARCEGPFAPGALLFPRYEADCAPRLSRLQPEEALRGLVEADCVIKNLTQARLEALAAWISAMPAFSLAYPDLETGLGLVRQALDQPA